ncbi:MAG: hypothetical protein M5U19_04865 [Microthrixaceae bacterium]|nr:hypothetical protein [Microthrixaceae bacterium]
MAFVAAALFAVVTMAMWMWMLFVYDPGLMIDELPDRTFPTEAEKICAATNEAISDLPPAETTDDPIERAGVIDTANIDLATMLVRLAPPGPDRATRIGRSGPRVARRLGDASGGSPTVRGQPAKRPDGTLHRDRQGLQAGLTRHRQLRRGEPDAELRHPGDV